MTALRTTAWSQTQFSAPTVRASAHGPLITVLVPTYNRRAVLGRCIESIYNQTHRPIELIVVDDGSTDGTDELLAQWHKRLAGDDLFRFHARRQPHQGAPAARNLGITAGTGKYLQWFDSDDIMAPTKLQRQVEVLERSGADFAVCDLARFTTDSNRWTSTWRFSQRTLTPAGHIVDIVMNTCSPLFRRESLSRVGLWDIRLGRWQDLEYTFRAMAMGLKGLWLPDILYLAQDGEDAISRTTALSVHKSYLRACLKIERTSRRQGIYDRQMSQAMGRRMAMIYRMLAEEGQWQLSDQYFTRACRRMSSASRALCSMHRLAVRWLGCGAMRKMRLLYRY